MNAITFLIKEHDRVRKNLAVIAKKTGRYAAKRAKFKVLCQDLIRHEMMEQKVWYPAFKNKKGIKKEVRHLLGEEKHAEKAIKKIIKIKEQDEWETNFKKFKKEVEHHAKEEEDDLFPNVEEILDEKKLALLGKKMQAFKKSYKKKKI